MLGTIIDHEIRSIIMSEIVLKIKKAHREGRLIPVLKSRINPYLKSLKYVVYDPASNDVVLHSPNYTAPS